MQEGRGKLYPPTSSKRTQAEKQALMYLRLAHEANHEDARETFIKLALDAISASYD